jgi:protein PhnA
MSLENTLLQRSHAQCELCAAGSPLTVYAVPPVTTQSADNSVMLCDKCLTFVENPSQTDANHWRCLSQSMWIEYSAVQVMVWRLLKRLSNESWAEDLLNQLYLPEDVQAWAEASGSQDDDAADDGTPTKDSNGNILKDGDSVSLIKDLEVKGANFTAKRGTVVKNILLTSNPAHVEGRVNGMQIVLVAAFLKKAN